MSVLASRPAPDFTATAIMPDNSINENFTLSSLKGKPVVLFFWPLDFTFVCPTEIIAHDHRLASFTERGVEVVGVSIDSHFTHLAWKNTAVENGGIGNVQFTMVSDLNQEIMKAYDVVHPDGPALRASFLIDKDGVVQHQVVNNLPLGRNVDEMLRMVDAMQYHEKHGEVCPAGWQKGEASMEATTEGVAAFLAKNVDKL